MQHVVLCGDSVFDNHAYVNPGEPDVVKQVRERLPKGSTATLLAMDGDLVAGVEAQLMKLPKVCNEDADYANPIEPSARGGAKIAERIVEVLRSHDFTRRRSESFF